MSNPPVLNHPTHSQDIKRGIRVRTKAFFQLLTSSALHLAFRLGDLGSYWYHPVSSGGRVNCRAAVIGGVRGICWWEGHSGWRCPDDQPRHHILCQPPHGHGSSGSHPGGNSLSRLPPHFPDKMDAASSSHPTQLVLLCAGSLVSTRFSRPLLNRMSPRDSLCQVEESSHPHHRTWSLE